MDLFTEVYKKSKEVAAETTFDKRWSNFEPKLKALFGADGPEAKEAAVLDLVRTSIRDAAGKSKKALPAAIADEILALAKPDAKGFQDRAALIKLLEHFYFVEKKGNQSVWVVDHPSGFPKWCYDQLGALSGDKLTTELAKTEEAFGDSQRQIMSDSLQLARKWCLDILVKLGTADDKTKTIVDRWFFSGAVKDEDRKAAITTLSSGFKKIADLCNTTKVIFSDRPHIRSSAKNDTLFASVNSGDKMPVIYIFKLFLEEGKNSKGEVGKLWLCGLTIIHELSHKVQGTKDLGYDTDGLKPGGVNVKAADAINNADSWGYFAANMVGALSDDKLKEVYK